MEIKELLRQVQAGEMSLEAAEAKLKDLPYEDLGFAKLDFHRKLRSGFPETVFCQGKPDPYLVQIFKRLYERNGEVLGTRADERQYELIKKEVPQAVYDPVSRIIRVEPEGKEKVGCIAVCTGGTADIPVAEEAAQTAEFFGSYVTGSTTWGWRASTGFCPSGSGSRRPTAWWRWPAWREPWAR